MSPHSLFFQKDNPYKNALLNSQSGAINHFYSFQNLDTRLARLSTQSFDFNKQQQPPSIHGYEEFELRTSLIGSKPI